MMQMKMIWYTEVFVYSQYTCKVKGRVSDRAGLVTTHFTNCWLISLVGTPNSELTVAVVPLACWVELVIAFTFSARVPVFHFTSAGGLEPAAVQVARGTSSLPKKGRLSFTLVTGGTTRITKHKKVNTQVRTEQQDTHSYSLSLTHTFLVQCFSLYQTHLEVSPSCDFRWGTKWICRSRRRHPIMWH